MMTTFSFLGELLKQPKCTIDKGFVFDTGLLPLIRKHTILGLQAQVGKMDTSYRLMWFMSGRVIHQ